MTTRLLTCACLWLAVSAIPVANAQGAAREERLLKAVFIFNFAKFTRWPENAWVGKGEQLILCTAGKDSLVDALRQLSGKTIQGRPVTILPMSEMPSPKSCHVLYVATSERERYEDIIETVRAEPVLTVSELPQFGRHGGIIELYREKGRIRFIINLDAARRAGLVLSSRLLKLAVIVKHGETP